MALNRVHRLYTPHWQQGLVRGRLATMAAEVVIYAVTGDAYDPDTDTWGETTVTWYSGPGRVQPLRSSREDNSPGNTSTVQAVLVSVPISVNAVDFRPGLQVRVLECELNPSLTEYALVLEDVVDSSNPFEKTFTCNIDQEDTNG